MNKKNYIDKIELILKTSGKYITNKEKEMILDYVNYFKTKNNVIEDKNIELVIENERLNNLLKETSQTLSEQTTKAITLKSENKRLNNIIKEIRKQLDYLETYSSKEDVFEDMKRRLNKIDKIIGSDKD